MTCEIDRTLLQMSIRVFQTRSTDRKTYTWCSMVRRRN